MATIDIGKVIFPLVFTVGGVVVGMIAYNYLKSQGYTGGFRGAAYAGNIIQPAGAYPGYGRFSSHYGEDTPNAGPEYSYPTYATDPLSGINRRSQSERQVRFSNIDRDRPRYAFVR